MNKEAEQVDQTAIKTAQLTTLVLLLIGFVLNYPWIVAATAAAQLLGATGLSWAPFRLLYRFVLKPLRIAKPKVQPDHHAPHRFASLVGGLFNTAATVLLFSGAPVPGWVLVWIVIILANLNVWIGFCLGCWMYYTLNRLGLPGFGKSA